MPDVLLDIFTGIGILVSIAGALDIAIRAARSERTLRLLRVARARSLHRIGILAGAGQIRSAAYSLRWRGTGRKARIARTLGLSRGRVFAQIFLDPTHITSAAWPLQITEMRIQSSGAWISASFRYDFRPHSSESVWIVGLGCRLQSVDDPQKVDRLMLSWGDASSSEEGWTVYPGKGILELSRSESHRLTKTLQAHDGPTTLVLYIYHVGGGSRYGELGQALFDVHDALQSVAWRHGPALSCEMGDDDSANTVGSAIDVPPKEIDVAYYVQAKHVGLEDGLPIRRVVRDSNGGRMVLAPRDGWAPPWPGRSSWRPTHPGMLYNVSTGDIIDGVDILEDD